MFDRILMMGVSPVTMDDLTSGYNIATNITTNPWFNQVLGFSEPEVRAMLDYYRPHSGTELTTDEMLEQMRPWYDNDTGLRGFEESRNYEALYRYSVLNDA